MTRRGLALARLPLRVVEGSFWWASMIDLSPDAFIEFLSADEPLERARGHTRAWIDTSTETLARVDVSLSAHSKAEGDLHVDASQGYTSYEAEIEIEAPEVQVTPT